MILKVKDSKKLQKVERWINPGWSDEYLAAHTKKHDLEYEYDEILRTRNIFQ